MPLAGYRDVAIRTWREASKDHAGLVAAGVAFYAFLALVPLMGATVLTYGLVADAEAVLRNMATLASVMPDDVAMLVREQLTNVVNTSSGKKGFGIVIALIIAFFGSRNAAGAIITALNIAYEEEEKRGFFKVTLLAIAITASAVVLALLAVGAITVLRFLADLIPGAPAIVLVVGRIFAGIVLALGAAAAAATLYRYAPSRAKAKWSWLTPGTALAALGWLLLTFGFGIYVSGFAQYGSTYGSLGAVVTWIYLSSYIFLFGAELNSEFEHQTARDTTEGAPDPLGSRGAWSADHVASGSEDQGKEAEGGAKGGQRVSPDGVTKEEVSPVAEPKRVAPDRQSGFVVSRATNRAGRMAGLAKVGILSSALSTLGLALIRRKGRAGAGIALLGGAVWLSLPMREDKPD